MNHNTNIPAELFLWPPPSRKASSQVDPSIYTASDTLYQILTPCELKTMRVLAMTCKTAFLPTLQTAIRIQQERFHHLLETCKLNSSQFLQLNLSAIPNFRELKSQLSTQKQEFEAAILRVMPCMTPEDVQNLLAIRHFPDGLEGVVYACAIIRYINTTKLQPHLDASSAIQELLPLLETLFLLKEYDRISSIIDQLLADPTHPLNTPPALIEIFELLRRHILTLGEEDRTEIDRLMPLINTLHQEGFIRAGDPSAIVPTQVILTRLFDGFYQIGIALSQMQNWEKAHLALNTSWIISEQILDETKGSLLANLADGYRQIAEHYDQQGKPSSSLEAIKQAMVSIFSIRSVKLKTLNLLIVNSCALAKLAQQYNETEIAENLLEEARHHVNLLCGAAERRSEQGSLPSACYDVHAHFSRLISGYCALGKIDVACDLVIHLCDYTLRCVLDQNLQIEASKEAISASCEIAVQAYEQRQFSKMFAILRQANVLSQSLQDTHKEVDGWYEISEAWQNIALLTSDHKFMETAESHMEAVFTFLISDSNSDYKFENFSSWIPVYGRLCTDWIQLGKKEEIIDLFQQKITLLLNQLSHPLHRDRIFVDSLRVLLDMAREFTKQNDAESAMTAWQNAVQLSERISDPSTKQIAILETTDTAQM